MVKCVFPIQRKLIFQCVGCNHVQTTLKRRHNRLVICQCGLGPEYCTTKNPTQPSYIGEDWEFEASNCQFGAYTWKVNTLSNLDATRTFFPDYDVTRGLLVRRRTESMLLLKCLFGVIWACIFSLNPSWTVTLPEGVTTCSGVRQPSHWSTFQTAVQERWIVWKNAVFARWKWRRNMLVCGQRWKRASGNQSLGRSFMHHSIRYEV